MLPHSFELVLDAFIERRDLKIEHDISCEGGLFYLRWDYAWYMPDGSVRAEVSTGSTDSFTVRQRALCAAFGYTDGIVENAIIQIAGPLTVLAVRAARRGS